MKKYIIIKADTNDGDYVIEKTIISDEDLVKLKEILSKMPRQKHWEGGFLKSMRYETREIGNDDKKDSEYNYITNEEKEFLNDYLPSGDKNYSGIHTIEDVELLEVVNETKLI
jgi:hypothetical protein